MRQIKKEEYSTKVIYTDNWLWAVAIIAFIGSMIWAYCLCFVTPWSTHPVQGTIAFLIAAGLCIAFVCCIISWYNRIIEIEDGKT